MKRSKHAKPQNKRKIVRNIFTIILLVSLTTLLLYLYNMNKEKQETENVLARIEIEQEVIPTNNKTERMLQLEELQKQNSEIIGYLEIEGTNISYPVCQTTDNDYYLTHNYKREEANFGSLFLDKDFDLSKPSTNYLIYGHRSTAGTMFEDLIKYSEESFYKDHPTIRFTTTAEDATYEIISVFYSRVYYKDEKDVFRYYYFINAETEEEYNEYVENCKKASIYDIETTATYGDQLLTLSTCEYSRDNGRFAVVAKKK